MIGITLLRTVQFDVTFYRCPWPVDLTETKALLSALIDAGLPGSLDVVIDVPLTRVSRQTGPDGDILQIAIPGDDGGDWRAPILDAIEDVIGGGGS